MLSVPSIPQAFERPGNDLYDDAVSPQELQAFSASPWRPTFQIWCDLVWTFISIGTLILMNYAHSLIVLTHEEDYFYCLIKCLLTLNKVFFTTSVFTIVYDSENRPKFTAELYMWRLGYDVMIISIDAYLVYCYKLN